MRKIFKYIRLIDWGEVIMWGLGLWFAVWVFTQIGKSIYSWFV